MTRDLIYRIITGLVDQPESVTCEESFNDEKRTLVVRVAQRDMAKVIGMGGRMFRALRTIATVPFVQQPIHDLIIDAAE